MDIYQFEMRVKNKVLHLKQKRKRFMIQFGDLYTSSCQGQIHYHPKEVPEELHIQYQEVDIHHCNWVFHSGLLY